MTNRESIEFKVQANRVRLQLLQNLLPPSMTSVLGQSGALSGSKESVCHVRVPILPMRPMKYSNFLYHF